MSPRLSKLVICFNEVLGTSYHPSTEVVEEVERFLQFVGSRKLARSEVQRRTLIADINKKFRINGDRIKAFLTACAKAGTVFNYHQKNVISSAFDASDITALQQLLGADGKPSMDLGNVSFASERETIQLLKSELRSPTLTRKDSKPRDWSREILEGLFCAYVCRAYGLDALHAYNCGVSLDSPYESDFWLYLKSYSPELHSTKPSLVVLDASSFADRDSLLAAVAESYQALPKFGYAAIWLDPATLNSRWNKWEIYSDIVLFGEKHLRRSPTNAFFRSKEIEAATVKAIPSLDRGAAEFEVWNDGFYYQDCFVIGEKNARLLVLMQKSEADETPIPCPGCRSLRVQGNSYSSLGVKSWECCNVLCPDKSKFGRGKRYSFVQLLKQAAIEEPGNDVPVESVKRWLRDVQPERTTAADVLGMLLRHYTLAGDTVLLDGFPGEGEMLGRTLTRTVRNQRSARASNVNDFFESSFFRRYNVDAPQLKASSSCRSVVDGALTAMHGDAGLVLKEIPSDSLDGAVTSPPYFNAREYSQWENIYGYLYDMRRVNAEVYRTLKPGAYYLYNIFDYFDNENSVVLSAMGEKRLILGAYTVDLFRRIGFEVVGNVVWDKGDIEGKRGFNGGNFSPYYQAPFNCWEHVLVFRKPGDVMPKITFPEVIKQGAVIKMIRGENTLGHTAPYPEAIPALLADRLAPESTILDPFGGSMTTAIAAARRRCNAICVEQNAEYFNLGLRRFRQSETALLI